MLVLSRKVGESISIGENVVIKIVSIDKSSAKIGIEAPRDVVILREELKEAVTDINLKSHSDDESSKLSIKDLSKKL